MEEELISSILTKIENEIETQNFEYEVTINNALYMVEFIRPLFEDLRTFIHGYVFSNKDKEIDFFKSTKPNILSKLLYFNNIYTIELKKPSGGIDKIKEYYKEQLVFITNFLMQI